MSGTAYNWGRWLGNPLPFYDDPATRQATQQPLGTLAAPAQDTGWITRAAEPITTGVGNPIYATPDGGWSHTAPSVPGGILGGSGGWMDLPGGTLPPYTAPSTIGGAAGGTTVWDLPDWSYGGNQKGGGTYNQQTGQWDNGAPLAAGADVFGAKLPVGYDSAQDRGGLNLSGKNVETFWSRMLRFAKDYRDGAARDGKPMTAEQAMGIAIERIRRDNGGTLDGTGFEGGRTHPYQADTPGQPPTPTPTLGGTGDKTGGNGVDPSNGTGLPIPGSTTPGSTSPVPMGPLNSIGGEKLANSPELAWRYLISQMGGDPDYEGPFSVYMQQNYAPLLASMIQAKLAGAGRAPGAQGLAGMDQIGNYIGQFGGMLGGNDLFTQLGGIGAQGLAAGGGLLNTASSKDAGNFIRQMTGLTGAGNGALGQSAQQYLTNKMLNDYAMSAIGSKTGESPLGKFGTYFQGSGFLDKLRQFGLLQ